MLNFSIEKYFSRFGKLIPYLLAQVIFNFMLVQIALFSVPKPDHFSYRISGSNFNLGYNGLDSSYLWPTLLVTLVLSLVLAPVFGTFIRLVVRSIIDEKEVNQLNLLKESLRYYWRFVGIVMLMIFIGLALAFALFILGFIPILGIIAGLASLIFIIYLITVLTPWFEYMVYADLSVSDAYDKGYQVGKLNFWKILLLIIVTGIITSIINKAGGITLLGASIALFLSQALDIFRIIYVMSLCKKHKEDHYNVPKSDFFTEI